MDESTMLTMLKMSLGITTDAYDTRLSQMLTAARSEIQREGAILSADSITDCNLVIQYAEWMWRRRDTGEGMPRMVRWQLNNRIFDMTKDEQNG